MQYSPKLKKAMREIKRIMREHDINGFVMLHTPGYAEYLNMVDASYSAARMERGQLIVTVKDKKIPVTKKLEMVKNTSNFLRLTTICLGQEAMKWKYFSEEFDRQAKTVTIDHGDPEHTGQDEIDN